MTGRRRAALIARRHAVGHTQETLAEALGVERSTVVRWELGTSGPQPWRRRELAAALSVTLDELDRLLTACAVDKSRADLDHGRDAARGDREVLRRDFIGAATGVGLAMATAQASHRYADALPDQPFWLRANSEPQPDAIAAIRSALGSYPGLGISETAVTDIHQIERLAAEVHRRYQAADYGAAARILPGLITSVDTVVAEAASTQRPRVFEVQSSTYVAAAKLVTKVGDGDLAWLTADRAANAALRAGSPTLTAAAAYQVACAFLKDDRLDDAERVALGAADNLHDSGPVGLSLRGALVLLSSVIAARRNDPTEVTERLRRAQSLADTLGEDGNYGWTAFGPTNVLIHSVATATELGDAGEAIVRAEGLDVAGLPKGLLSRRAQVHIDVAWAYLQRGSAASALVNLLKAERVAAQTLRYNVLVRELLREMLKRERCTATTGLRALAQRVGVAN